MIVVIWGINRLEMSNCIVMSYIKYLYKKTLLLTAQH